MISYICEVDLLSMKSKIFLSSLKNIVCDLSGLFFLPLFTAFTRKARSESDYTLYRGQQPHATHYEPELPTLPRPGRRPPRRGGNLIYKQEGLIMLNTTSFVSGFTRSHNINLKTSKLSLNTLLSNVSSKLPDIMIHECDNS